MAASVFTNHSLIGGLIYVFLWEGVVTQLFTGTRYMSVRQYTLGLADLIAIRAAACSTRTSTGYGPGPDGDSVAPRRCAFAVRRLSRFEMNASA